MPLLMRVDSRTRVPALALHELVEGEYQLFAAAAAGSTFVMREPFAFSLDPADLRAGPADLRDGPADLRDGPTGAGTGRGAGGAATEG